MNRERKQNVPPSRVRQLAFRLMKGMACPEPITSSYITEKRNSSLWTISSVFLRRNIWKTIILAQMGIQLYTQIAPSIVPFDELSDNLECG